MIQNHLFQVLTNLAMEPPVRTDSESIRDEKVKVLKAMPPLQAQHLVRGQFRATGRSREWRQTRRWKPLRRCNWRSILALARSTPSPPGGVLPVTLSELPSVASASNDVSKLQSATELLPLPDQSRRHLCLGINAMAPGSETVSESMEILGRRYPHADEMDAYERVIGDAMEGDATLFAREDYVEEAWRIVDPVLKAGTPVYAYAAYLGAE